jgi:hypothetical protein
MARKAKSSDAPLGLLVVAGGVIWAVSQGSSEFWSVIAIIGAGVGIFVIIGLIVRNILRNRVRRAAGEKAAAIVKQHLPALVRRREQLVRQDAYGRPLVEDWVKEISYFIEQHIQPPLTPDEQLALVSEQAQLAGTIYALVETEREKNPAFLRFSDDMTPSEFETFCAEELRRAGWNARVTMQSRDQGVDVVAEKSGVRVVVQCKLYARPVGNKSVQEAAAARAHEQADYGIVVSNNRYTQDAEQLASTNKIFLLHYTELANLQDIIRLRSSPTCDSWYYADGAAQVGPLTLQALRETLATFSNAKDVLVWCNQFRDWKPAKDIPELKASSEFRSRRVRAA